MIGYNENSLLTNAFGRTDLFVINGFNCILISKFYKNRLQLVRQLECYLNTSQFIPGFNRWRNIEGILEFFIDRNISAPGSWDSVVDSCILEAVERSVAIAAYNQTDDFANPGSSCFAQYLIDLKNGLLQKRSDQDIRWGTCEQEATDYGTSLASSRNLSLSFADNNVYQFSQAYRFMLRNPQLFNPTADANALFDDRCVVPETIVGYITDVTLDEPARKAAIGIYDGSYGRLDSSTILGVQVILAYVSSIVEADYLLYNCSASSAVDICSLI